MAMLDLCMCLPRVQSCLLPVVLAALAGMLAGCGAKSQPVADASSKFRPADESEASAASDGASANFEAPAISPASGNAGSAVASRADRTPSGGTPSADAGNAKKP